MNTSSSTEQTQRAVERARSMIRRAARTFKAATRGVPTFTFDSYKDLL